MPQTPSLFKPHSRFGLAAYLVALAALPSIAQAQTTVSAPVKSDRHGSQVSHGLPARHWGHREITFHVTPNPKDTRTPEQVRALIAQGIGLWNEKLNGLLQLRLIDDATTADAEIHFVAPSLLHGNAKGRTEVQFTLDNNEIRHAVLQIADGLPSDVLVQTVAQQCGRALGIQGHSHDKQDLISANPPLPATVTDGDVSQLRRIYPAFDEPRKTKDKDTAPPVK